VVVPWHLGDVVRKLREGRRWSLRHVSRTFQVGYATVSRLENGETLDTYEAQTLKKLAGAFGVSEGELLDAVPPMQGLTRQQRELLKLLPAQMSDADYQRVVTALRAALRAAGSPPSPARTPGPRRSAGGSR
jgi:transcriptional regulator with XRE-family HTH domain